MYTRIRLCHNHHPETAGEDSDYLVVRPSDGEDSRAGRDKRRQARRPAADRRHRRRPGTPAATTAAAAAAIAAGKASAGTAVLLGHPKERTARYLYSRSGGDPAERTGEAQPYQAGGPFSRHAV